MEKKMEEIYEKKYEELYEELKKISGISNFYEKIKKENLWDSTEGRIELPSLFGEDPMKYALMPTHGFIASMEGNYINIIKKANEIFYNEENFYKFLEKYDPEEIGQILFFIPCTINPEKIKDKDVKIIAQHHRGITEMKKIDVKKYRELIKASFLQAQEEEKLKIYGKSTLPDEGLEEELKYNINAALNYLVGYLKKIKKEKLKK